MYGLSTMVDFELLKLVHAVDHVWLNLKNRARGHTNLPLSLIVIDLLPPQSAEPFSPARGHMHTIGHLWPYPIYCHETFEFICNLHWLQIYWIATLIEWHALLLQPQSYLVVHFSFLLQQELTCSLTLVSRSQTAFFRLHLGWGKKGLDRLFVSNTPNRYGEC